MNARQPVRIIGMGNFFAGDDAVGILVARQLKALAIDGVDIIEAGLAGFDLLDLLEGTEAAIVIDAVQNGIDPGTILRLEIPRHLEQVSALSWSSSLSSTHGLGLGEALTLGITLGTLPPSLTIYGIELGHITQGEPLSRNVLEAIEILLPQLVKEIEKLACTNFS